MDEPPAPTPAAANRAFLLAQVEGLAPFDFVFVGSPDGAFDVVEVARSEGGDLSVRVPPRPDGEPLDVRLRTKLHDQGFTSPDPASALHPWEHPAGDGPAAVDLALGVLRAVFGHADGGPLDVAHGSHLAEHEATVKLTAVREKVERVLQEITGSHTAPDDDGDYLLVVDGVKVFVAPRVGPTVPVVLRVFAISNAGMTINADLGQFIARVNFGLTFGRFALDVGHQAIWFDETLLGEHTTDEELRFTIEVVAETTRQWDQRIKGMFGGVTQADMDEQHHAPTSAQKPGFGGYL